jgi:hypothetical protein
MTEPSPHAASPSALHKERVREQVAASWPIVKQERIFAKTHPFAGWLNPARVPEEQCSKIEAHFRNASPAAREAFAITVGQDGEIVSYDSRAVLLKGRKAG